MQATGSLGPSCPWARALAVERQPFLAAAVTPLPETSQALLASLEEARRRLVLPVILELDPRRGGDTAEGRPGGRAGSPSQPGMQR